MKTVILTLICISGALVAFCAGAFIATRQPSIPEKVVNISFFGLTSDKNRNDQSIYFNWINNGLNRSLKLKIEKPDSMGMQWYSLCLVSENSDKTSKIRYSKDFFSVNEDMLIPDRRKK